MVLYRKKVAVFFWDKYNIRKYTEYVERTIFFNDKPVDALRNQYAL